MLVPTLVTFVALVALVASSEPNTEQESCSSDASCASLGGSALMQQLSGLDTGLETIETDKGLSADNAFHSFAEKVDHLSKSFEEVAVFSARLELKAAIANSSHPAAVTELNDLIGKFVSSQSNSEDKCSSQLLEAKHQLNQLHDIINDLAADINSTQTSIQTLQVELSEKKEEQDGFNSWSEEELKKCKDNEDENRKMLNTLKGELEEMHHIARPDVTMNIAGGSVGTGVALLQESKPDSVSNVQALVTGTRTAQASLMKCQTAASLTKSKVGLVAISNTSSTNTAEATQPPAQTPAECENQKKVLEKTYVKTYVELSRLIMEYEEKLKSKTCEDDTHEGFTSHMTPLEKEINDLMQKLADLQKKLEELRPKLEDAYNAEKALRKQIAELTKECASLPETISDLNKVRDVISAMSRCPDLHAAEFNIPVWTEGWVEIRQQSDQSDAALDAAMHTACANKFQDSDHYARAAEASEIISVSIEGMPTTNTGTGAIVGACPLCEGDSDVDTGLVHASGHARICWEVGAPLNGEAMKKGCSNGMRSVLCVYDRGNIRRQTREKLGSE